MAQEQSEGSGQTSSKELGPISRQQEQLQYLTKAKVPELMRSLVAGLMVERPTDPYKYLDTRLEDIKIRGMENIDWESFVFDLHPTRVDPRAQLVQETPIPEETKGIPPYANEDYQPQLFQLTEPTE